jgi:hypothetical protein
MTTTSNINRPKDTNTMFKVYSNLPPKCTPTSSVLSEEQNDGGQSFCLQSLTGY